MFGFRLLYTQNIRGDLDLLPRLYTYLRNLAGNLPEQTRGLRLDTGNACAVERWPCDVTGGRAAYLALDAMGYTAANVRDVLSAEDRETLRDQVALGLVDADIQHMSGDIGGAVVFSLEPAPLPADIALNVMLAPSMQTRLDGRRLWLAPVEKAQVGVVILNRPHHENGTPYRLASSQIHTMPPGTNPDPTIAGVIDFIKGEARYYQKRRGKSAKSDDPPRT